MKLILLQETSLGPHPAGRALGLGGQFSEWERTHHESCYRFLWRALLTKVVRETPGRQFPKGHLKDTESGREKGPKCTLHPERTALGRYDLEARQDPRSDGLPVELYVKLWDLIGPDLLDLYEEMVGKSSMPQSLREGMITLLYKQKGEKEDLKNWRPISLLNVDYKIQAKAMANRLKKLIAKIVHPDQTCGIPG
ncbi:hypothetical protein NDU88_003521 [Pleurodeles waltl]|uniref:Uncharacterized protein n=1 Tax=Pleurodeles waltl TaxID=8319 RepID=A0AAV7MQZ3_PLEWA|nr:hypothetical protein NDU88_003521 [Pleurodeles waltl]